MSNNKPSWQHALTVAAIRPFGLGRRTPEKTRESVRKRDAKWTPPKPPTRLLDGISATWSDSFGWPVWTLSPAKSSGEPRNAVVAVHGGGYTSEIILPQWSFYASLARDGVDVIIPVYPLAPHGTAGTVVPVVADIIGQEVERRGANKVGVEGDSAGAGLALAAVQQLILQDRQVPERMVLISPWLDATISDPRSRDVNDPLLNVDGLAEAGKLWAGDLDPADPLVSPLNGSLDGLPPMHVYSGSLDILYPDSLRLQDRAKRESKDITFDLRAGLLHGWAGFSFLPEAKQVAAQINQQLTGLPQR